MKETRNKRNSGFDPGEPPEDNVPPVDKDGFFITPDDTISFYDIARQVDDLYISYRGRFVMMTPETESSKNAVFVPRHVDPKTKRLTDMKLANKMICAHLNGKYAVCVFAGSASSKFMTFDVDDGSKETVRKIVSTLVSVGFPKERIYISSSGGKGFHVEMFFSSLMFTSDLRDIYEYVCSVNHFDRAKIEFRPTSGQAIKLPLGVHRKTGKVCWFLDQETLKPIRDQKYIVGIKKIPHDLAVYIARSLPAYDISYLNEEEEAVDGTEPKEKILSDEEMAEFNYDRYPDLVKQGKRHAIMTQIAAYNKYREFTEEESRNELIDWYRRQDKSLINSTEEQVMADIDELLLWAYGDKFIVYDKSKEVVFRREDLKILFMVPKVSQRKILFLIMCYQKSYGNCCHAMRRIAEKVRVSLPTVEKEIGWLLDERWLELVSKSKAKKSGNCFVGIANRYVVSGTAYDRALCTSCLEKNHVHLNKTEVELGHDLCYDTANDIASLYAKVMGAFLSSSDLKKVMTGKEYKEYKEYEQNE